MHHLTTEYLKSLLGKRETPCISLYQPTHRRHPENQQDPIRFKNLVRAVENSLRAKYPNRDVREFLEPFHDLAANGEFWNHARDGLAMLAGPGVLDVFKLQRTLPELAVVADSFHVKPLVRYLQSADRFQVLCLTRDRAAVYEGNRYALDLEPAEEDFPSRLEDVVSTAPGEQAGVSVVSSAAGVGSPKMLRGHGDGKYDADTEKYFRAVDQAVTKEFSKPSGLPLVLVAPAQHHATFRKVARNPLLLSEGVSGDPQAMSAEALLREVWKVIEPHYLARLERLKENFTTAQARQAGSGDLADVARAAVAGRVGILLVESERVVPGVLDRETGAIRPGELSDPDVEDMLDDLAEVVLERGGEVVAVPRERMPTATGLAATYRY